MKAHTITRRRFITAAASATAFQIVPRRVLGGPGQTPPSGRLNIAKRAGGRIAWDAAAMRVTNNDAANRWVERPCREGWSL